LITVVVHIDLELNIVVLHRLKFYTRSYICVGLLETPVDSEDIPIIRNTKFMYQSCINISMIFSFKLVILKNNL